MERLEARPAQLLYLLERVRDAPCLAGLGRGACLPMPLLMRLKLRCLAGNDPAGKQRSEALRLESSRSWSACAHKLHLQMRARPSRQIDVDEKRVRSANKVSESKDYVLAGSLFL